MSHEGKRDLLAKTLLVDLLMGIILLLLFSFAFWLIWLTFFREYFDTGIIESNQSEYMQGVRSAQVVHQKRFHNVDDAVITHNESASNCSVCHYDLPHLKSKEKRAFLNAHSYFVACEVCHNKTETGSEVIYRWSEKGTGRFLNGEPKRYTAKITPTVYVDGQVRSLESVDDKEYVMEYLKIKDTLSMDQIEKVVDRTHSDLLNKPISCNDCHTMEKNTYIPFAQLAYSEARIEELTRIEVVGMVKRYEHFFMPHLSSGTGNRD